MTKLVCNAFKWGGILVTVVGLLFSMGRDVFASNNKQVEWVVVQGTACVDANKNAICSASELALPNVVVRSEGVVLATTDATGRFSIRVPAQSVIEFEVPAGYEAASDTLSTQVFESGRVDVPLTKIAAPTAVTALPTATALLPTAAVSPISASPTARPTRTNTPAPTATLTPKSTLTPEPSTTASPIPPTLAPSTKTPKTPAPTAEATAPTQATETSAATALATATAPATEAATATPSAALAFNGDVTAPAPTDLPAPSATPINPAQSFEAQAQPAPRFSVDAIPRVYLFSVVGLFILAMLLGWLVYRANSLKTNAFATASVAGGFGPQPVAWEQGAAQSAAPVPRSAEWQPIAQRLIHQSRLKSIAIDADSGILVANNVPAPIFVLNGLDGSRLVFTIDPSLPVRSGLVGDRSQIMGIAALRGASRNDAHALWSHVARLRNLPHVAYPTWADWYLVVC